MSLFYKALVWILLASGIGAAPLMFAWLLGYAFDLNGWLSTWPLPYIQNVQPYVQGGARVLNCMFDVQLVMGALAAFFVWMSIAIAIRFGLFLYHQFWGSS